MAYDRLLREGRINTLKTRNRIIAGPMERVMGNRDGTMTQRYVDYLVERARGGASLINVESTFVNSGGQGNPHQIGCHDDKVIPGLTRLADALHAEGAALSLELYHAGRQSSSVVSQQQPISASVVPCTALDPVPVPREMTVDDIATVRDYFVAAAHRCLAAGVDMILLHGAHGYLLGQFLSPYSNRRTDEYGGSVQNRQRFPIEVYRAVREVVGPDYPIGYRLSLDEYVDGGLTVDDTIPFCERLVDEGIDLIDVSGGVYETVSHIIQGAEQPRGAFLGGAAQLKRAVGDSVPVSVTQRLGDPDFAEAAMERDGIDYVSLSRAFHADPHFVRKLVQDRPEDILPCIGCNTCLDRLYVRVVAQCAANPHSTFERARMIRPTPRARNVVVVGGGPSGMQAARILARQGNKVTLLEARDELGGQLRFASRVVEDYGRLVTWLSTQLQKLGVDVRLNEVVDADAIERLDADVVIIATGVRGALHPAPIAGSVARFDLISAFERPVGQWDGERVAILGADGPTSNLALYLARQGADVHLVEPNAEVAADKGPGSRGDLIALLEAHPGVHLHRESTVEAVHADHAVIQRRGVFDRIDGVGSVVVGNRIAENALYENLVAAEPEREIYAIGDCVVPDLLLNATHTAAEVAEVVRLKSTMSSAPARVVAAAV